MAHHKSTSSTKITDFRPGEPSLPPGPGLIKALQYFPLMLSKDGLEKAISHLVATYGSVVRIETGFPSFLRRFIEACISIQLRPYILLAGPEANNFVLSSDPALIQRAPTVPSNFPAKDGSFGPQPSIASIDGEIQIQQHRLVMQAFRGKDIAAYVPLMRTIIEQHITKWEETIDIYEALIPLTLEILARTMLGIKPESDDYQEFVTNFWRIMLKGKGSSKALIQAKETMWTLLHKILDERYQHPADDALSAMIAAVDRKTEGRISDDDLLNYAYMLVEFGHSDIVILMTYAISVLAKHQQLKTRLLAEYAHYSDEAVLALEQHLPLTLNILREVERFYSPVPFVVRYVAADTVFNDYLIPAGSWAISLIQQTHFSPAVFANPYTFDPDRFTAPRLEQKTPYALMGFGGGYHVCVAKTYTRVLSTVLVQALLQARDLSLPTDLDLPKIDYSGMLQKPQRKIVLGLTRL